VKTVCLYASIAMSLMTIILWIGICAGNDEDKGKTLYTNKCEICHGAKGDGNGPAASSFSPKPKDFNDPKFWQDNPDKKITDAIENGFGAMPAFELNSDQIKEIIDYMSLTFRPAHKK
jgi:mono/diheme cytochrome c family protein